MAQIMLSPQGSRGPSNSEVVRKMLVSCIQKLEFMCKNFCLYSNRLIGSFNPQKLQESMLEQWSNGVMEK
jgi:hypothetical protein